MCATISGIFGGGKKKEPKVVAPEPIKPVAPAPRPEEVDTAQRDRDRRRQRIAAAGRGGTILTQGQSLSSGSATLLGRSNA
jgi:hypothetical protein